MKIVDLSHKLNNEIKVYPGDLEFTLIKSASYETNGYVIHDISTNMHVGTHIDAPMHMGDEINYIGDYNIDTFYGEAAYIDVSESRMVIKWSEKYKEIIGDKKIVILNTGWHNHFNARYYYAKHPELSEEFADKLVGLNIKILAIDTPSPDYEPYKIHNILLSNNIFIVENITNLEELKNSKKIIFHAIPLNINAEASLVRAYAIIE